ncbi:MAG: hypothetical protein ACRBCK_07880 [Alphaproteobacteria bacterium]
MLSTEEKSNSEAGIILSLDYLKLEAEKDGNLDLCMILDIAHQLAEDPSVSYEALLSKISHKEDMIKASLFVVQFLSASQEMRDKILSVIDLSEQ